MLSQEYWICYWSPSEFIKLLALWNITFGWPLELSEFQFSEYYIVFLSSWDIVSYDLLFLKGFNAHAQPILFIMVFQRTFYVFKKNILQIYQREKEN